METLIDQDAFPSGPLRERVKELKCLHGVIELTERTELSREQILQGIVDLIPEGWQYPEVCRARVTLRDVSFNTAGFTLTPWLQRASLKVNGTPIGTLEVCYLENRSAHRDDPFLLEEKKLIELIGKKLSRRIEEWEIGPAPRPPSQKELAALRPEWQIVLDLLKETDSVLYKRILRRLMNHLDRNGVPGVQGLVLQFNPAYQEDDSGARGDNQPLPKRDVLTLEKVFDEAIWIASIAMPDDEMSALIKKWMRQDKFAYLIFATDKRDISRTEISDILGRFCRATRPDEQSLSSSGDLNVRVALIRRFLSERLSFIRIAKEYMTIHDFGRILSQVLGPTQGTGKLGGKAAGLVLAEHVLRDRVRGNHIAGKFRVPQTRFITSDGLMDFIHNNYLEDMLGFKFSGIEEIRHNFPYIEQLFKHSHPSPEIVSQLKVAIEELGEGPLIVRSSSLLEDSEGSAFSGKYRSLFLPNIGTRDERLAALTDAIAEVYASIFGPDAIQYRAERGLLDYMEEMGILIQRVVGRRVGKYFFPAFAGVSFSTNEFRWSPRVRREDGVLRIVTGLGTRAVDRVGDDYPVLISPGQPGIRVNVTPQQVVHYAQKNIDLINLESGRFETHSIDEILKEVGDQFPCWDWVMSVYDGTTVRKPSRAMVHPGRDPMVVTFAGLIENTPFLKQLKEIMRILREAMGYPVDVEFAHDGADLHILQCRPQSRAEDEQRVTIPQWIPEKRKLFSAHKYVTNAHVRDIKTIVYVDAARYAQLASLGDMVAVGDAVSRLNSMLPRRSFILIGPGRWGSRGDIRLGVRVTYSDINNAAMLIEVARKVGNYVPDLSFGTHFFQDLVEARIRYLALYPDEEGAVFAEQFFHKAPSVLTELLPEYEYLADVVRVIDVPAATGGCELNVVMDGEGEQALAYLVEKH
ncbi:MAG: PEP/pyruvate-binding domain-containing protein [Acidobacteriota bacterium]